LNSTIATCWYGSRLEGEDVGAALRVHGRGLVLRKRDIGRQELVEGEGVIYEPEIVFVEGNLVARLLQREDDLVDLCLQRRPLEPGDQPPE
jgi:hypothetical protein